MKSLRKPNVRLALVPNLQGDGKGRGGWKTLQSVFLGGHGGGVMDIREAEDKDDSGRGRKNKTRNRVAG